MLSGKLNRRATVERRSVTRDPDYGTDVVTWVTQATVWCEVQDILPSRSEAVKQGLAVAQNQTRIRMRYRTDIDSSMRITLSRPGAVVYQIISGPAEIGNKELIEFIVERSSS